MLQKIISNKEISPYFYSFSRRIRLIFSSLFLSRFSGLSSDIVRLVKERWNTNDSKLELEFKEKIKLAMGSFTVGGGGEVSQSFTRSSRLLPNIYLLAHWDPGWLVLIQQESRIVYLVAHSCRFRPTSRRWRVRHEHSLWWLVAFHKFLLVKIQINVWCQLSVHCLVLNSKQTQYNNQLCTLARIWKF